MSRGSVWTDIEVYTTNKDGTVSQRSFERIYTYGGVYELNTIYQRQLAFEKCISKGLATYRQHHNMNSDDEVNYYLINDGIQYQSPSSTYTIKSGKKKGTVLHGISYKRTRLTPSQKRESHKKVIGKILIIRKEDIAKQYLEKKVDVQPIRFKEMTEQEYLRNTKKGIVSRGRIAKPPSYTITRHNVRNYLGMNKPASEELHLSKKSRPKRNEIFIDKSLKGRKKRQVIAHEIYEQQQMNKGMKYRQAHKKATKMEKKVK